MAAHMVAAVYSSPSLSQSSFVFLFQSFFFIVYTIGTTNIQYTRQMLLDIRDQLIDHRS